MTYRTRLLVSTGLMFVSGCGGRAELTLGGEEQVDGEDVWYTEPISTGGAVAVDVDPVGGVRINAGGGSGGGAEESTGGQGVGGLPLTHDCGDCRIQPSVRVTAEGDEPIELLYANLNTFFANEACGGALPVFYRVCGKSGAFEAANLEGSGFTPLPGAVGLYMEWRKDEPATGALAAGGQVYELEVLEPAMLSDEVLSMDNGSETYLSIRATGTNEEGRTRSFHIEAALCSYDAWGCD